MHIKSMVIDGFKSYGSRTEINGFDPFFNAITGLNGSGKSNILDGICFLLGITNLTQVRAANLHELVYKNGQAGVTKATVSITFDNKDKKHSPISYEQYDEITVTRQVVVGGRNKYLINGLNAQNSRVQDLFHSVQLNVNNPHFLIMQGRITKVLNMKPPEILSMIEEAAGTKMYESKKQSAQRTIEKKDAKLKEIDALLAEEIAPTLNKLKEERASYLEYQKIQRELDHLTKLWIAFQFVSAEELCVKSTSDLESLQNHIEAIKEANDNSKKEIKELEIKITQLEKKRSQEGGKILDELEANLKTKQLAEAKMTSNLKNVENNIRTEEKKKKELQKNIDEDANSLKKKEKQILKMEEAMKQIKEESADDVNKFLAAQKRFQAASAGLSSNTDGEDATLADQLINSKSELAKVDTDEKGAKMKLIHAQKELASKKKEQKIVGGNHLKDKEMLDKAVKEVEKLGKEIEKIGFEPGSEELVEGRRRECLKELNHSREKLEELQASFPYLSFDYVDPEKNFDRSKVYGPLCTLFQINDISMATALEAAAGGKLYNIVVEDEITAKKILEKGQLKKRVTFIPLNKISSRSIPADVVNHAQRLVGENNVSPALNLMTFDPHFKPAMEFAFGSTFVCPDMNSAKKVAFDPKVQKVTVTYDGEIFNPSGTLSGGSKPRGSSVLTQVGNVAEIKNCLKEKKRELEKLEDELKQLRAQSNVYHGISQKLDVKRNEVNLLQQKLQQSKDYVILEDIKLLEANIDEMGDVLKNCDENRKKLTKKIKELTAKLSNMTATRDKELKDAEKEIANCKAKSEKSSKLLKEKENEIDVIKLEKEELEKGLKAIRDQMTAIEDKIKELNENYQEVKNETEKAKEELKAAMDEVEKQKELLKSKNKEIQEVCNSQEKLTALINANDLKLTTLNHEASKHKTNIKESGDRVKYLTNKYEWIPDERKYFGQPNTAYDFNTTKPNEADHQIKKLEEKKNKLARNVNMGAMNMLNKAEEQYQDLMKKKRIVENDKSKIATVIKELDEKKNEALVKAWEQVNKDFGSIFSILLPGAQAKLVPPESLTVLDGLEVKVAFGDVWKESLTELSGGQRSLVALSLILSMLLFKPAPIYILDEVDAALDLSHTQNIGQMLRTHFKHSQFIVVSLKDGMFNNANVLFKTKFVDGMSTVVRFAQRK